MKIKEMLFLVMISLIGSAPTLAHASTKEKPKLYIAAALFNGRETRFNLDVVEKLEAKHYRTLFPQRDGFEYKFLQKSAAKYLSPDQIVTSARNLIYLLDIGVFIPESDIVVANLDEPLDEGVIVEITYAHLMGKPVIGYRTDVRTPYGTAEGLGGMHSFVALQCDYLIKEHMLSADNDGAERSLALLVNDIDNAIKTIHLSGKTYAFNNPVINKLMQSAKLIIQDPADIHSDAGMQKVIKRMADYNNTMQLSMTG